MARRLSEEFIPEETMYENLDTETDAAKGLIAYLQEEHRKAIYAHSDYYDYLRILRRAIAAKPNTKVKTFPWPGASNLVVPLIRIAGDAVKARILNTILAPTPFWVCTSQPGNTQFSPFAKPVERFMDWAAKGDLDLVNTAEAIVDQIVYLGKCPIRISWEEVIRKVQTYDPKTGKRTSKVRTMKDSPSWQPILLENWLEPWGIEEPKDKTWNAIRVFYSMAKLKEMSRQGLIVNFDKLQSAVLTRLPPDMVEASEDKKLNWAMTEIVTLYEYHVMYDFDSDGFREELIVLMDPDLGIAVQLKFNFFFHGHRPIETMFYLRDSFNRSTGDGLGQLLYPLQDALSTCFNQRTDNSTIANTRFWKGRKGEIKRSGANSQIFPGQVMLLNDPVNDLVAEKMGDVSGSQFTQESTIRDYAERLSGISDPQLGREYNNPRVAATTTLSILQEGNRRFDMVVRLCREVFSTLGIRTLQLYQQFKPRVSLSEILSEEDQGFVQQILDMSPEDVETNMILSLNTSTATVNKETQRQGLLALHQLLVQFYGQIIQIATTVMINPQVHDPIKDMITEMAQTSYNTLKEIVRSYDINDPSEFLVDVAEALNYIRQGGDPSGIEGDIRSGLAGLGGMANGGPPVPAGGNPSPIPQASGLPNQEQLAQGAVGGGGGGSVQRGGVAIA